MIKQTIRPPSLIEYKYARFLITDAPTDNNLPDYIQTFEQFNVTVVARTCDPSYSTQTLEQAGIDVEELGFPDGAGPPEAIVKQWLALVIRTFRDAKGASRPAIAIHCVAGLGRAPVLVAIALVELGMDKLAAIEFIRERRPKAFNVKQIHFIENYKRTSRKNCVVM